MNNAERTASIPATTLWNSYCTNGTQPSCRPMTGRPERIRVRLDPADPTRSDPSRLTSPTPQRSEAKASRVDCGRKRVDRQANAAATRLETSDNAGQVPRVGDGRHGCGRRQRNPTQYLPRSEHLRARSRAARGNCPPRVGPLRGAHPADRGERGHRDRSRGAAWS
jgi:hypothetical protein